MPNVTFLHSAARERHWLEKLIFSDLVFPMCWEDPAVDARAFRTGSSDVVLTVTSAGCNALNLLLQGPRRLICIDGNPAQNALLELKLASIETLEWQTFWEIFSGSHPTQIRSVYGRLRPRLSSLAANYWDRRLKLFDRNLYCSGRMGAFFQLIRVYLRASGLDRRTLTSFFELETLREQKEWYLHRIAPKLWSAVGVRLVRSPPLLYLSGVHPKQLDRLNADGDIYHRARHCVEHAMTELSVRTNYFWQMAILGRFMEGSCPPYLMEENFSVLRERVARIEIVYGWLDECLDRLDAASVDGINLRDTLDWMGDRQQDGVWRRVERVASPRACVVLRSAAYGSRLPDRDSFSFDEEKELSNELTFADRSATHGRVLAARRVAWTPPPDVPVVLSGRGGT